MNKSTFIWSLFFCGVLFACWSPAFPCTCIIGHEGAVDYTEALKDSEVVFRGRVLRVVYVNVPDDDWCKNLRCHPDKMAIMHVLHYWKGISHRRVYIFTGSGAGDCGFDFRKGEEYIVWATRDGLFAPGELSTTVCSLTVHISEGQGQLNALPVPKSIEEP